MFLVSSCMCLCSIPWSQVLSREWRCSWSSADRQCSNYIWVIDNFIAYKGASYIWDFTVYPRVLWRLLVPFHKSQDTLLHPGLNDQIQNTLFTEDPHETRALWGWFDWLPGSACADLNWSALVNHIGIHPLPATQPTLIGHALYIKPRPSQFSVPHAPPCMHGNGEIFVCNI